LTGLRHNRFEPDIQIDQGNDSKEHLAAIAKGMQADSAWNIRYRLLPRMRQLRTLPTKAVNQADGDDPEIVRLGGGSTE
jgi:hypothetical protein